MYIHLNKKSVEGTAPINSAYLNQLLNRKNCKIELNNRESDCSVRTFVRKIYLEHKEDIFYAEPGRNESNWMRMWVNSQVCLVDNLREILLHDFISHFQSLTSLIYQTLMYYWFLFNIFQCIYMCLYLLITESSGKLSKCLKPYFSLTSQWLPWFYYYTSWHFY